MQTNISTIIEQLQHECAEHEQERNALEASLYVVNAKLHNINNILSNIQAVEGSTATLGSAPVMATLPEPVPAKEESAPVIVRPKANHGTTGARREFILEAIRDLRKDHNTFVGRKEIHEYLQDVHGLTLTRNMMEKAIRWLRENGKIMHTISAGYAIIDTKTVQENQSDTVDLIKTKREAARENDISAISRIFRSVEDIDKQRAYILEAMRDMHTHSKYISSKAMHAYISKNGINVPWKTVCNDLTWLRKNGIISATMNGYYIVKDTEKSS